MRRSSRAVATGLGAVAGVAAAAYAAERIASARLRRRPDGDAGRALEAPAGTTHRVPSHDGGTIHVVEAGTGPVILLSHGVTLSVRTWFHQLEALPAAGFRVVAFDHRGHGHSVAGGTGHSLDNLGEDVRSVVEALDLRDAVLVGHSMGGIAAQLYATRYAAEAREHLRGLVLLSTLARVPFGSRTTRLKDRIERVTNHVPDTTPLWASPDLGFLLARLGFGRDPKPSHVELVRQMMLECPSDTRLEAPRALVGLDLADDLATIELPTLVIGGTADIITPPAESRRLARLIPGARLELFDGGGHMLMLEHTEELNRSIAEFAREVCGAARVDAVG